MRISVLSRVEELAFCTILGMPNIITGRSPLLNITNKNSRLGTYLFFIPLVNWPPPPLTTSRSPYSASLIHCREPFLYIPFFIFFYFLTVLPQTHQLERGGPNWPPSFFMGLGAIIHKKDRPPLRLYLPS